MRHLESLAVATVFIHAGQDLVRGEPAALGIPAWTFAAGFLVYAALLAPLDEYPTAIRLVLAGVIPILVGLFHLIAQHHGGFYMPIVYATLVFGVGAAVQTGYRDYPR